MLWICQHPRVAALGATRRYHGRRPNSMRSTMITGIVRVCTSDATVIALRSCDAVTLMLNVVAAREAKRRAGRRRCWGCHGLCCISTSAPLGERTR